MCWSHWKELISAQNQVLLCFRESSSFYNRILPTSASEILPCSRLSWRNTRSTVIRSLYDLSVCHIHYCYDSSIHTIIVARSILINTWTAFPSRIHQKRWRTFQEVSVKFLSISCQGSTPLARCNELSADVPLIAEDWLVDSEFLNGSDLMRGLSRTSINHNPLFEPSWCTWPSTSTHHEMWYICYLAANLFEMMNQSQRILPRLNQLHGDFYFKCVLDT